MLALVVEQVLEVFPNVVCVDDGSPDGSAEAILSTGAHLVRHPVNLGQGAALQTGLSLRPRPAGRARTSSPSTPTASTGSRTR